MTRHMKVVLPPDLPPFDADADCSKCGSDIVNVLFHRGGTGNREFPCCDPGRLLVKGEHLCRVCARCGHAWCEATVETKPARRPELRVVGANERPAVQASSPDDAGGQ